MSEEQHDDEFDYERRSSREGSMRRRSIANSRTRSRKRAGGGSPTKYNGIHRRRTKRSSW